MRLQFFRRVDYLILLNVLTLTMLGILFIYSAGINSEGALVSREYSRQIVWAGIGFFFLICAALFDYRRLKRYVPYVYAALLLALLYIRFLGHESHGARSWIGVGSLGIQPAELGKIVYILFLAWYLERTPNEEPRKRFIVALFIMCLPMGLILLQPDLGTASVYLPIFIFMCFMTNIPFRYLMLVIGTGLLTIVFTVLPIYQDAILHKVVPIISVFTNTKLRLLVIMASLFITLLGMLGQIIVKNRYYYWITYVFGIITMALLLSMAAGRVLKPYQTMRLIVFLDPSSDPQGSGWHIMNSKIAIGAGGLWGRGFKQGTQSHYHFIPEQNTDFIFSILAEEAGFWGGLVVFACFLVLMLRIIQIIRTTPNMFGCFIAAGILGMFFFHFVENVGMVMGIMPITGIPLPFLSYGGSALLTAMISSGILMSISSRRLDFNTEAL